MRIPNDAAPEPFLTTRELTAAALMTAIICVLGPVAFPLPFSPVPVSLGTLGVYLSACVLGMKHGTLSVAVYLLLGLAGLPVFTGFSGGPGKIMGPTGGYLFGYLFIALTAGFFTDRSRGRRGAAVAGMMIGTCFCYLFGTLWLSYRLHMTFLTALGVGVLPYLPGDAAKIAAAAVLSGAIRSALRAGISSR